MSLKNIFNPSTNKDDLLKQTNEINLYYDKKHDQYLVFTNDEIRNLKNKVTYRMNGNEDEELTDEELTIEPKIINVPLDSSFCFPKIKIDCPDSQENYIFSLGFELENDGLTPLTCYPNNFQYNIQGSTLFSYKNRVFCPNTLDTYTDSSNEALIIPPQGYCKSYTLKDKRIFQPISDKGQELLFTADTPSDPAQYLWNQFFLDEDKHYKYYDSLKGKKRTQSLYTSYRLKIDLSPTILETIVPYTPYFDYLEMIYTIKSLPQNISIPCWVRSAYQISQKIKEYFKQYYNFKYSKNVLSLGYSPDDSYDKDDTIILTREMGRNKNEIKYEDLYDKKMGVLYPKNNRYQLPVILVECDQLEFNPLLYLNEEHRTIALINNLTFGIQGTVGIKFENCVKFLKQLFYTYSSIYVTVGKLPNLKEPQYYKDLISFAESIAISLKKDNTLFKDWITLKIFYLLLDDLYLNRMKYFGKPKDHIETDYDPENKLKWDQNLQSAKNGNQAAINVLAGLYDPRQYIYIETNNKKAYIYGKDVASIFPRHSLYQIAWELFSSNDLKKLKNEIQKTQKTASNYNILKTLWYNLEKGIESWGNDDSDPDAIYEINYNVFTKLSKYRIKGYDFISSKSTKQSSLTPDLVLFEIRNFPSLVKLINPSS